MLGKGEGRGGSGEAMWRRGDGKRQITRQRGTIHAPGCRLCQKKPQKNSFVARAYPAPLTHAGEYELLFRKTSGLDPKGGGA